MALREKVQKVAQLLQVARRKNLPSQDSVYLPGTYRTVYTSQVTNYRLRPKCSTA